MAPILGAAAVAIKPFGDLQAGQKGTGTTAMAGNKLVSFDFEIIDLLQTGGFAPNLIVIRVSGPAIDQVGGIAYGMSGSPLYIDNALIGAVAMTTSETDAHWGYATPIEDMLRLLDAPLDQQQATYRAWPGLAAGTAVRVSGLAGRAARLAGSRLRGRGLRVLDGPVEPARPIDPLASSESELVPGSAVSCALATGDVSIEASGTVTWRDGDRLLAFGHPFRRSGSTAAFLQASYIAAVLPSTIMPSKLAIPLGGPLGTFTVDRQAGLAGRIGPTPPALSVEARVRDLDLQRERTLRFEVVRDADLAPTLVASAVLRAADEVMDRNGAGSASMRWELRGTGLSEPLVRQDRFYSPLDIGAALTSGAMFGLQALMTNDFVAVEPSQLVISIELEAAPRTIRLTSLAVDPPVAAPGQVVRVHCSLQEYRGEAVQRVVELTVPLDAPPGRLTIEARGRDAGAPVGQAPAGQLAAGLTAPKTFDELVAVVRSGQKGDVLQVELLTPEALLARRGAVLEASALPSTDPLNGEPTAVPAMPAEWSDGATALARAETQLAAVVTGRVATTLTVRPSP